MTGPKLNEKSFVAGERSGTKATARYVRSSASKARAVLDLIRGLDVRTADEVLQFTDRHIARDIRKVLASAVANAVNNDDQDADELFVIACFADEGPTLRRFRPRARGRATRINKRSCHITVIVARMSDDRIAIIQARQERAGGTTGRGRPQSSAASRRARVERSRQQAAGTDSTDDVVDAEIVDDETIAETADEQDAVDATAKLAADADDTQSEVAEPDDAVDSEDTEAAEALEAEVDESTDATDAAADEEVTESDDAELADAAADVDAPAEGSASDEPAASEGSASDELDEADQTQPADESGEAEKK
jgi:large subunit ribosomal protein L22